MAQQPDAGEHPQGWYPDPWQQAEQRWWDGTQWTEQLRAAPAASEGLAPLELRREIVAMLKQGKYAKPFGKGRFASFSVIGTNDWEDYANLIVQMIQADTLMTIEEKLDALLERASATNS